MSEAGSFPPDKEISADSACYEMNMALLDQLSELEAQSKLCKENQRFWARNGLPIASLPLLTSASISYSPLAEKFEPGELYAAHGAALYGAIILGVIGLFRHDKHRDRSQELAELAVPLSRAVNNSLQPWIVDRLEEKRKQNKVAGSD